MTTRTTVTEDNIELELARRFIRETDCNLFLTGKAGTGKTTFLQNLRKESNKRLIVAAPTGVAAINAGGVTLHSLFQLPFGPYLPGSGRSREQRFTNQKINLFKSLDLLVIDEVSMVRADLLDGVDEVLRRFRRSSRPFGGVQLLLIGDLHQLSPVVKDNEWQLLREHHDSPYFFSSNGLRAGELFVIELRHIYRQADQRFIDLLNMVRDNRLDEDSLSRLNQCCRPEDVDDDRITLCTHNSGADAINRTKLTELKGHSYHFRAEIDGEFPESFYPTDLSLELKRGARVMFIRNDPSPEKQYFNGKIGRVSLISDEEVEVTCDEDNLCIRLKPTVWENSQYRLDPDSMELVEEKIGSFSQIPLRLAWAITIHKSQGLTFDRVAIDAQAAFAPGQVYVALSRCRSLEGLQLSSPLSLRTIKTDPKVISFTSYSEQLQPTPEKLAAARVRYQQRLLIECFDLELLGILLRRLLSELRKGQGLLQLIGGVDSATLEQIAGGLLDEVVKVSANFQRQLDGLFTPENEPSHDPLINERLEKAADYFGEKLTPACEALHSLDIESDNKETQKRVRKLLKQLKQELELKREVIDICGKDFTPTNYLRSLAEAEVTATKPAKTKSTTRQENHAVTYSEADVGHPELFSRLRNWRLETSKSENLAPFQVMHQKPLIQVAIHMPTNLADLTRIKGIGKAIATRYGEELLEIVAEYRRENEIETVILPEPSTQTAPEDDAVENVAAESGDVEGGLNRPNKRAQKEKQEKKDSRPTRLISLELFEQGLSMEEIAAKRDYAASTIESHLSQCVEQGELGVEQLIAPARLKELAEKIELPVEEGLKALRERLGESYSYGELKIFIAHLNFIANSVTGTKAASQGDE